MKGPLLVIGIILTVLLISAGAGYFLLDKSSPAEPPPQAAPATEPALVKPEVMPSGFTPT